MWFAVMRARQGNKGRAEVRTTTNERGRASVVTGRELRERGVKQACGRGQLGEHSTVPPPLRSGSLEVVLCFGDGRGEER